MTRELKTQAWRHQREAFEFAHPKKAAMLAMGMGTGKSRVVVDLIVQRQHRKVLIVCPKAVMQVWPKQFLIHDPETRAVEVFDEGTAKSKADDLVRLSRRTDPFVAVMNYDVFWREPLGRMVAAIPWDLVVLDESHRIKAPGGRASFFARKLTRAPYRLCLTGTPTPHSPLDLYAQFRFLEPSIFGTSFTSFRTRYAVMGGFQGHQVVGFQQTDELNRKFYSIAFRVDASVLDLPEKHHIERTFKLTPAAKRAYLELESELCAQVADGIVTVANAMVKVTKLQQIACGFVRLDDEEQITRIDDGRQSLLAEVLDELAPEEPVVVFARFKADLAAIHAAAMVSGRQTGELSGARNDLARWQAGEFPVLAVQIQSGGVGIDLTLARYAVYYSLDFSLGNFEQSLARLHRPGQSRQVTYVHLICEGTIDRRIYRALRERRDAIEAILAELKTERSNDGQQQADALHGIEAREGTAGG